MSKESRTLIMRANRLMGAQLVEHNLVKIEDLEVANEKFIEVVSSEVPRQTTILGILAFDMKVVKEDDVLHHIVESDGLGLVDLRDYDVPDESKKNLDVDSCWATWSVPFDREEEFFFVATAYYLSPAVRSYWEKELGGPILWFGTTLEGIADYLEKHAVAIAGAKPPVSSPSISKTPFSTPPKFTRAPFNASAVADRTATNPPVMVGKAGTIPPVAIGKPGTIPPVLFANSPTNPPIAVIK